MPVIVAFGDSNTWGSIPAEGARYSPGVRWPGVMARELGTGYQVIEEGLRGRTTVFDDPDEPGRNGFVYFAPCLLSHAPLDLVIIALGCNDCKAKFGATPGRSPPAPSALSTPQRRRSRVRATPRRASSWSRRRRSRN